MMRPLLLSPFLVILPLLALNISGCKGGGSTLAKVGGSRIVESDLDLLVRVNPRLGQHLATPAGKQKILENYVEQEMLYQESQKRGLHRSSSTKDKMDLYKKIIIAQALLDDELEKKAREYYQNRRDEFERVRIAHILIRTAAPEDKKKKAPVVHSESEALKLIENVRARLTKGEDFGKLAKDLSEDERTKNTQGELGYVTLRDKRLERWGWLPVAEKAFAMKAGESSDAIKTKDGFHVIKVIEEKKLQPMDEAEAGIRFRLQADIRRQLLDDLRKKYKVEYAKAAAPSAAPAQPETVPTEPAPLPTAPETTPPPSGN